MSYLSQELKLSFLFGAGAETTGNFGLPSGDLFFKQSLLFDSQVNDFYSKDDFNYQLGKVFNRKYFKNINEDNVYYKYGKSFIEQDSIYLYVINKFIESLPKEEVQKKYSDIIDFNSNGKKLKKDKNNDAVNAYKNNGIFKTKCEDTQLKDLINAFFANESKDTKLCIAGFLEKYFHTIANPKKLGDRNFTKIFNYYWAAFFSIINKLVPELVKISKDDQINHYKASNNNYITSVFGKDKISNFNKFIQALYNTEIDYESKDVKNSYYALIRNEIIKFKKNIPNFSVNGIITTNYYNFAEQIIGTKMFDDTIQYAYPNGQLKYFEFPELLEVKDFTKDVDDFYKDKLFFPFIFGQSYLKPEVNQFQLQEMNNLNNILNNTNCLIILGYNLNEDDNHINSYLHNYLLNPENKIVYLHHPQVNDEDLDSKKKSIRKSLRFVSDDTLINQINSQIIMKTCSNNEDVTKILDELFYK